MENEETNCIEPCSNCFSSLKISKNCEECEKKFCDLCMIDSEKCDDCKEDEKYKIILKPVPIKVRFKKKKIFTFFGGSYMWHDCQHCKGKFAYISRNHLCYYCSNLDLDSSQNSDFKSPRT